MALAETMQRAWGQMRKRITRNVKLAEARCADHFTLAIIRAKARSAEERLAKGFFGKCTCCSGGVSVGILHKDPSHPYCNKCEERFAPIREMIYKKMSFLKSDLGSANAMLREVMSKDSVKSISGDLADATPPNTDILRRRINVLKIEIQQCEEVLLLIARGEYDATCVDCDEELSEGRINIKPHAKRCCKCAEEQERLNKLRNR